MRLGLVLRGAEACLFVPLGGTGSLLASQRAWGCGFLPETGGHLNSPKNHCSLCGEIICKSRRKIGSGVTSERAEPRSRVVGGLGLAKSDQNSSQNFRLNLPCRMADGALKHGVFWSFMKVLMLLFLGFVAVLSAQDGPTTLATATHFRWSEALAHELDYGHTIKNSSDLSVADKAALTNAVLLQLKRDDDAVEDLTEKQVRELG